jgi:hypothetical protein
MSIFKNPIVHGVAVFVITMLAWFLTTQSPILTMTVGGVGAAVIAWLSGILA